MSITRTITLDDLTPAEVAEAFCELDGDQQASFFQHVGLIAREWPGAGWCQQSYAITENLSPGGREVIETLANHCLGYDGLKATIINLHEAMESLDCSDILGVAESCASGLPRWEFVSGRITAARAILAKATGAA